ncbi:MAG: hypothetical protein Tsb009_09650 [Planctomycetaceae bacterium]
MTQDNMPNPPPEISDDQLDELVERFESQWTRTAPSIAQFLTDENVRCLPLVTELVKIDIEQRWRSCQHNRPATSSDETIVANTRYLADYLIEFPELAANTTELFALIGEEYRVRHRWGDQPLHQEYLTRYANLNPETLIQTLGDIDRELSIDMKPHASFMDGGLNTASYSTVKNSLQDGSTFLDRDKATSGLSHSVAPIDEPDNEWIVDFLTHTHPFSELPKGILEELAGRMTEQEFAAGSDIIRQGDAASNVLVMVEGVAEVSTVNDSAQSHLINRVGSHTVLGEIALLTREPRSATVTATSDVHALALNVDDFHDIANRFPTLNVIFSELVAERVGTVGLDVLCGKIINDFRIERRLGRGSMGVVYEATDLSNDNRRVALKMMSHALIYDYQAVSRFHRETEIVESIDHPHIIRSYGKFTSLNTFFLVMEFCDGLPLSDVIDLSESIPESEIRALLGQLASALDYTHSRNIVHRDLKPGNVFVQWDGCVKLMDFGLARADENPELTQHGQLLGTPRYMPPEQLAGQQVGPEADIYALGCIAYELLTGEPMHSGKDPISLMRQQLEWTLPEPAKLGRDISEELYQFLQVSLAKEPDKRAVNLSNIAAWAKPFDMSELSAQVRWEAENPVPNDDPTIINDDPTGVE